MLGAFPPVGYTGALEDGIRLVCAENAIDGRAISVEDMRVAIDADNANYSFFP